jgi:DNA polymerase
MNNLEILKWYVESGVDDAVGQVAVNKLKSPKPADSQQVTERSESKIVASTNQENVRAMAQKILNPQPINPSTANTGFNNVVMEARKLADSANSVAELRNAVMNFEGCAIKKLATNTVFSDGDPNSRIMLIGEAPGANEDEQGVPFCGASGQLLDEMMKWVGLSRKKNVYISNMLFWRPPGNRTPTTEELEICQPFVERHIALVRPELLIFCGGTAASFLLNSKVGITRLRGKFHKYSNQYLENPIDAAVLFHPSYLLRSPGQKAYAWRDLLEISAHAP